MSAQAIERVAFVELVRQALGHINSRALLQAHPLCAAFAGRGAASAAEELQEALLDAVRQLRPTQMGPQPTAQWRRYRYLWLRYVEGVRLESIAETLGVTDRQARRDHREALEAVAAILWTRSHNTPWSSDQQGDSVPAAPSASRPDAAEEEVALDAELGKLQSELGHGPTSLGEALEATLATASRLIESHRIRLNVAFPINLPPVAVSQLILKQILMSLLAHAAQQSPGGELRFAATGGQAGLALSVTSSPSRGPTAAAPSGPTAGQESPLELARRMVEREGGSLSARWLPSGAEEVVVRLPASRMTTVLVIDDNLDFLRLCQRYLEGTAYRVLSASLAAEALRLAREAQPDAILLDVLMPTQDGWELLASLQQADETRHIPVMVCSVMREPTLALELGAVGFLLKPVTRLSLLAALERTAAPPRADPGSFGGTP